MGNLFLVFHGFHGSAFSTALRFRQRISVAVITAHHVRPIADRDRLVQVLMDGYRATGQRVPPAGRIDLPDLVLQGERVVFRHVALSLYREDPVQIRAGGAPEGRPFLGRGHCELAIELRHVVLPQELIGLFHSANAGQSQLLR